MGKGFSSTQTYVLALVTWRQGTELPETDSSLHIFYATTLLGSYIPNLRQASESGGRLLTHSVKAPGVRQVQLYLNAKSLWTDMNRRTAKEIRLSKDGLKQSFGPWYSGFHPPSTKAGQPSALHFDGQASRHLQIGGAPCFA